MANRNHSPARALRRLECTGGQQFFFYRFALFSVMGNGVCDWQSAVVEWPGGVSGLLRRAACLGRLDGMPLCVLLFSFKTALPQHPWPSDLPWPWPWPWPLNPVLSASIPVRGG